MGDVMGEFLVFNSMNGWVFGWLVWWNGVVGWYRDLLRGNETQNCEISTAIDRLEKQIIFQRDGAAVSFISQN